LVVEIYDLVASLSYMRRGSLTWREWRQSRGAGAERAWFRRDDPLPFVMMCVRLLSRVAQRILRRSPAINVARRPPKYVKRWREWFVTSGKPAERPSMIGISGKGLSQEV
jgi:hypothetical protein